MERLSSNQGFTGDEAARAAERDRLIAEGIERAMRRGHRIDDLTAKRIAQALDPGSGPLHEFAETGAIPPDIDVDLDAAREVVQDLQPEAELPRLDALADYFDGRLLKNEMPYWNDPSME